MYLLRELTRLQEERGFLCNETLQELARRENVPLYHLEGLTTFYPHFRRTAPPARSIHVCRDVCCALQSSRAAAPAGPECDLSAAEGASGDRLGSLAEQTASAVAELRSQAASAGDDFELIEVSCLGRCDEAPVATLTPELGQHPTSRVSRVPKPHIGERTDPYSSVERRYDTVRALASDRAALAATAVQRLQDAGLMGMGGAGFPTGKKWELVAAARLNPAPTDRRFIKDDFAFLPQKYVICNADESEPGTFKDREILAQLPHLVIEGMVLAGLTIGACRGIVFIRHEYEPERQALEAELARARSAGVLGDNAAGSGEPFDIDVFVSPGGYILGEETALLECLEDRRGEPRNKPPYPGQRGLYGQPTLINNVETYALATAIIHHGAEWWASQGVGEFRGLKFVCISGDVMQPGVYEIPVGTTVAELIAMAGGVCDGRSLRAFLPGGASSNFLPASAIDTPLDFDAIRAAGSMLGTGAVIVFDETRNLFDVATNLVRFFRNESCGKCVPCRVGSQRAVELLSGPAAGTAEVRETLRDLNETLEQTSICGLGQVALHPVVSLFKQFPDESPSVVPS